jgi:hypothetical protein
MYSNNKEIRDVADVAARIMAGLPPLQEKLHPNQQKLDVHEPEKDELTSDDFKKLRAGKKPAVKKEEVEQIDEVKMADLPSTKVQGRSYGSSKPEPSAFDVLKGPKEKELKSIESEKKKKKMSEMVALYKEGGMKAFFESIKKDDLISEEPDSEQFAKELEDQKKRAAGTKPQADVAKASVQSVKQEEVEQIDELKKSTLGSYVKKASTNLSARSHDHGEDEHRQYGYGDDDEEDKRVDRDEKKIATRQQGIHRAATKLSKEEVEIQVINADLANGVDQVNIEERTLTAAETDKKEDTVKSMKKNLAGFKERYGKDAKSVMYATATKQAKND